MELSQQSSRGIGGLDYPGPRPLGDDDQLVGRDTEAEELFDACAHNDVVELTAFSGVGKTSFVRAGLVPMLRDVRGAYVPEYGTWAEATAQLDRAAPRDADEAAQMLYRIWIGAPPDDFRPLPEILAEKSEGRWTVVVLDQLEELIRYRPGVAEQLLRLAGRTAVRTRTPHVVVSRSEYAERLRPVEVPGSNVWPQSLHEIEDPATLEQIVLAPTEGAEVEYEPAAVAELIDWWQSARRSAAGFDATGQAAVGLLHFQALLWSFSRWARTAGRGDTTVVTLDLVNDFREVQAAAWAKREPGMPEGGSWLLSESLLNYVATRAEGLKDKLVLHRESVLDREILWRNGPRLMLARIAPALSAAGYKQPRSLYSLLPYALGDELTQRGASDLARRLQRDPGRDRREELLADAETDVAPAGIAERWSTAEGEPGHADDRLVVAEMIDCLHAAMKVMTAANVLREFEQDDPIYELVHDGMGTALNTWAEEFLDEPVATIGVIAAQPGRIVLSGIDGEQLGAKDDDELAHWGAQRGDDGMIVLTALRWPSSLIRPSKHLPEDEQLVFSDVRFRRCDFTGAFFLRCRFERVTFESCKLRATGMEACSFEEVEFVAGDQPQDLDLLTIVAPREDARIRFVDAEAQALVLQDLATGTWGFERCRLNHVIVEPAARPSFSFGDRSHVRAMSVTGGEIDCETSEDSSVEHVDLA